MTSHSNKEQLSATNQDDDGMMVKSPSLIVSAHKTGGGDGDDPSPEGSMDNTGTSSNSKPRKRSLSSIRNEPSTSTARLITRPNDTVVRDMEYSSHTQDMYQPSCIVEVPVDAAAGDQLLIRWPRKEHYAELPRQGKKSKIETGDALTGNKIAKKTPPSTNSSIQSISSSTRSVDAQGDDLGSHKSNVSGGLLVRITLPLKLSAKTKKKKGSPYYIKVLAPWLATERAASNSLNTRQLRSIGIDGHSSCSSTLRCNRRQRMKKKQGEGNIVERTMSRVGRQFQVSKADLPTTDTWEKERAIKEQHLETSTETDEAATSSLKGNYAQDRFTIKGDFAEYDQIWSRSLAENAASQGESIDQYINSLKPYQKAQGMMTLHQSNYKVSEAKQKFQNEQQTTETMIHHALLEGAPLSQNERIALNEAIDEHDKNWHKIAKSVGTTPCRCLIHYYSQYKWGDERERYLEKKNQWELTGHSDYCEICDDGGDLILCDGCPSAYHIHCIKLSDIPPGKWYCSECQSTKTAYFSNKKC
ncbi:hypothetical protein ACHAWT_008764 [Skeletonema menzelii]|mmetsp:Transcript_29292/g.47489  ORF Transcript_29292/g.47489 Transcript_29292/m.47489 type:complete len:529 (-) Transcript_29292:123-1709(-)